MSTSQENKPGVFKTFTVSTFFALNFFTIAAIHNHWRGTMRYESIEMLLMTLLTIAYLPALFFFAWHKRWHFACPLLFLLGVIQGAYYLAPASFVTISAILSSLALLAAIPLLYYEKKFHRITGL